MKKILILFTACLALTACSHTAAAAASTSASPTVPAAAASYASYSQAFNARVISDSWSAGVECSYTFSYSDDSTQKYEMDGTMAASHVDGSPDAHLTQNISSNGMEIATEGWYTGGRLYNTYANVNYYEDMTFAQLKQSMLVPMDLVMISESDVDTVMCSVSSGRTTYILTLNSTARSRIFSARYDLYDLNQYDGYTVNTGTIAQTFDADGNLTDETADFTLTVPIKGENVGVTYSAGVHYIGAGETEVQIPDKDFSAYVIYSDIDTDAISDADITDDQAEATALATLRKRLVGRLGYTVRDDGTYYSEFNDNESYTFDFANSQFTYRNYSSTYVYNWRGDTGGFGTSCNYNYSTETGSSDCQDSVLETLQQVKLYFEMELYYCGLSIEDLQAEG